MKLKVMERLMLLSILPEKGDFATLKILRQLQEDLSFTEKEHKELKIIQNGSAINWDSSKEEEVDIKIGNVASSIIVNILKEMDKKKELTSRHLTIYEKFIEGVN